MALLNYLGFVDCADYMDELSGLSEAVLVKWVPWVCKVLLWFRSVENFFKFDYWFLFWMLENAKSLGNLKTLCTEIYKNIKIC